MLRTVSTAKVNPQGRAVQFRFFRLLQHRNLNLDFHLENQLSLFPFLLAPAFCAFAVTDCYPFRLS